jgi:transcriptional regulator with XRE-family HTH domain
VLNENKPALDAARRFSESLVEARTRSVLTQVELAGRSQVALRTIQNLELPKKRRKVRFDVVVRLANALKIEPQKWLTLTGHNKLSQDQISQILKKYHLPNFDGENTPEKFFGDIQNQLKQSSRMVFCICFRTPPSTAHQTILKEKLAPLLSSGKFFLGIVCPYPKITRIENAKKMILSNYYLRVYSEIVRLTREIKAGINSRYEHRIAAFHLNVKEDQVVIMPTLGLSEFRPMFIQTVSNTLNDNSELSDYRLCGWLTFLQDEKDRIIEVFPKKDRLESLADEDVSLTMCLAWRDYLGEIIDGCDFRGEKGWSNKHSLGLWRKVEMQ